MDLAVPSDTGSNPAPDNLSSITKKARAVDEPVSLAPSLIIKRAVGRIPKAFLRFAWKRFKTVKCRNKEEQEFYGKRFRSCPVPKARRFGLNREERPWWCSYCPLIGDEDPHEPV